MLTSETLSMVLSNTATTALLLPVAAGIVNKQNDLTLSRLFMLCIAYGASIGGVATLVGSPPNAIAAGMLDIAFLEWLAFGLRISIVMLVCAIPSLWFTFRPTQKVVRGIARTKNDLIIVEQTNTGNHWDSSYFLVDWPSNC